MAIIPSSNWALDEFITIPKINQNYYIQSVTNLPSTGKEGQDIVYCTSSGQYYLYYNSQWKPINISGQIPIHGNTKHEHNYFYQESDLTNLLDDNYYPSSLGHIHTTNTSNPHSVTLEQARTAGNTLSGTFSMGGYRITNLGTPTDNLDATNKDYVDSKVQGLDWQDSVLDKDLTSPPTSPSSGDRYIVAANQSSGTATGDWAGHENDITEWNASSWEFTTPNKGFAVYVEDETKQYNWNGSSWVTFGSTIDHGNLVGLGDDDHTQYYNSSRLSTWWSGKTTDDLSEGSTHLYYTDERSQDAVGNILDDGTTGNIAFTYDDSTPKIYANLQSNEITISGNQVILPHLASATYTTVEDWFKTAQSAGKLTGGDITDNGDGTVSVSAGTGIIKVTNNDVAETKFINWSANSSLSLTDNSTNYVYVAYNSGSPSVTSSTSLPTDRNSNIVLGLVYREGTDIYTITAGQVVSSYAKNTLWKDLEINGKFQRVSGLIISEKSDRKFAITEGAVYAGLTKVTISSFDSSVGDTFTYYWRDGSGGWNKSTGNTQIDNTHYDDGSGTLATLSNSTGWRTYYGVHWVYRDIDGHVFVVYGRDDYLLSDAQNAQPPSDIPPLIENMGGLVGKIIIEKNADSFEDIQSAFEVVFTPATVNEHNLLGGLQGGTAEEYYHLTSDDYTEATSFLDGGSSTHTEIDEHIASSQIHFKQSDITTVGTITTGEWKATPIAQSYLKSGSQYWDAYLHSSNSSIHLTSTQKTDWTDGGDTTLHYHSSDRNLNNATGTLAIGHGGTNNTSFTSDKFIVFDGTKLSSSSYDNSSFASASHNHDDRYYTENECDSKFYPSSLGHNHVANTSNPHSVTYAQVGAIQDANDVIKDTHIDWGTGTNQVSLDDVPDGTTYARLTATQKTDLTDGGDSTLHYHSSDRDLSNATGTLSHEHGGLEADVSAYDGLVKIAGGSTSYVTDNHSNWDSAYTHSTTTTGNPHHVTLEQARSQSNTLSGDVDFNQNEALSFVIENRTTDPTSPVSGQIWFRIDLA